MLDRPIVIAGAPRSGKTLTGQFLAQHPTLAYLEEPRLTWRYGNDRRSDQLRPEDARPQVAQYIRNAFERRLQATGKSRLLEKTPSNALRLPFVNQVLPHCRFVHMMRDGRESALAIREFWINHAAGLRDIAPGRLRRRMREIDWRRAPHYLKEFAKRTAPKTLRWAVGQNVWGPRLPGIEGMLRELDLLEVSCLQWRMCVETACHAGRDLPGNRCIELRLEDLSPAQSRSVLEVCELDADAAVLAAFEQRYDPAHAGGRWEAASSADRKMIMRWLEPTLQWLGYV